MKALRIVNVRTFRSCFEMVSGVRNALITLFRTGKKPHVYGTRSMVLMCTNYPSREFCTEKGFIGVHGIPSP